jgi:hypothetical protein
MGKENLSETVKNDRVKVTYMNAIWQIGKKYGKPEYCYRVNMLELFSYFRYTKSFKTD